MKAAVIREFGDAEVLKIEDVPTPKPKPGNVLDQDPGVRASIVSPVFARANQAKPSPQRAFSR